MILTQRDFNSEVWSRLEEYLAEQLTRLRQLNDQEHNNELETASLRGQIKQVKSLLGLKTSDDLPTR